MRRMAAVSVVLTSLVLTVAARQAPSPELPFAPGVVRTPQAGVISPTPTHKVNPKYTPEAEAAKIEGPVSLECVVDVDGTVGDVRVTKSLDKKYGLDKQAIKALRAWHFVPATKDGNPIATVVKLEFQFAFSK